MTRRIRFIAVLLAVPLALIGVLPADAAPGATQPAVQLQVPAKVQVALQALDRLHQYGYTWTTDAGALKAIRHWQKVNGLTVDGIVGPETLHSLGLDAPAAAVPARRVNPPKAAVPAPQADPQPGTDGNVEAVIREVWPDDLEDHALAIVSRETGRTFDPTVRNACCYGLFQINWRSHRSWMAAFGVTSASQLLEARTNAEMGYQLYLRAGGWGPWDCHGQCVDV